MTAPGPQLSIPPNPGVRARTIHIDDDFIVVCKPAGLVTQPGHGHEHDALLNGLFATHGKQLQNLGKARDFGLLHRLDRPTSGLVLVGLTARGYDGLRAQFEARTLEKTYVTLVQGAPPAARGTVDLPIATVRRGGLKMARLGRSRGAKTAVTDYRVLAKAGGMSLVECQPRTGRLHQIRAHMAHLGCAVLGDRDYGPRSPLDADFRRACGKNAIFLHAGGLRFDHPVTGRRLTVVAPLPDELLAYLDARRVSCPRQWRGR
ncbi:MAG: RluA family pseudouridine synthase [Myxococcales bacterium]|nr:RluA family pseudouridine synthase [Myxococcales bacterium]MCB9525293.1 RluA family pseudouridine synthase [Myxococcales bacterium]